MEHVLETGRILYTRIRELREPAAFGGWIATIARNRATDHLRRTRDQVELPDELPGGDPIDADTFAVLDIVRKLPEAYRDTLLMRLVEGMSGNEIAERSGLTPASVRVNLGRGRDRAGLVFAVENLTNKYYREQFQFAPARGRSVTMGIRVGAF